jgi:diguanylate cyclase (GGDEF)-like protein
MPNMGEELVTVVWPAVVTAAGLWALMAFGLFRHRGNQLVWAGPGGGVGAATDGGGTTDPDIARRIASLLHGDQAPYDTDAVPEAEADMELEDVAGTDAAPAPGPSEAVDAGPFAEDAAVDVARVFEVADASPDPAAADEAPILAASDDPDAAPTPGADAEPDDALLAPVDPQEMLRRLLVDHVTGLGSRLAWDRWVADEEARERRYRRPTTLVVAEVTGLDAVSAFLGSDAAVRVVTEVADIVRANVRTSDHAALVGPARFAIMLPETDEVRAVNFVERVRAACDRWLEANAPTVGIGFGWASPGASSDLAAAREVADKRLAADLREVATGTSRP